MINIDDLNRMGRGLEVIDSYNISKLERLKTNVPFSTRLNNWITGYVLARPEKFVFVDEDDFDPEDIEGTYQKHLKRFQDTNTIHIWTGASDATIFGVPKVNHLFRAWHDYIHMMYGFKYDLAGEIAVADIQKSMLPEDWYFERDLVHIEVTGQALYHAHNSQFVIDQRAFTISYLEDPRLALYNKW